MAQHRIIFLPGLLEPHFAFIPMKRRLESRHHPIECFPDRLVFRNLDASVNRLSQMIRGIESNEPDFVAPDTQPIALITHSFGDWVARQAIAATPDHRVDALVSIAPAICPRLILSGFHLVTAGFIPEMQIITDPDKATASLDCDPAVRRMVIWANADTLVRPINIELNDTDHPPVALEIHHLYGTHLSIIMQNNTLNLIERFLGRQRNF